MVFFFFVFLFVVTFVCLFWCFLFIFFCLLCVFVFFTFVFLFWCFFFIYVCLLFVCVCCMCMPAARPSRNHSVTWLPPSQQLFNSQWAEKDAHSNAVAPRWFLSVMAAASSLNKAWHC